MRIAAATRASGLVLAFATTVVAGDDGPDLAAPADPSPVFESSPAPGPVPALRRSAPPTRNRPVLALPRARTPLPPPATDGDAPALIGPTEMVGPAPVPGRAGSGRNAHALPLETVRGDALDLDAETKPIDGPSRRDSPEGAPAPIGPRRSRLFGRPQPPSSRGRSLPPDDAVIVEPKSDPIADALLKRKLERQIQDALGERLRSLEVLVVDRRVIIQAKPARFWQRRSLRRSIQTLPGLSGYRTTINVED